MSTRKILLATPIKLGLDGTYMNGLVPTLVQQLPDIELCHAVMEGNAVNFQRNELVQYARDIGCREIVFIDDDMGWSFDHFKRLITHATLDIVAGLYCKRKPGKPFWLLNLKEGCEIDPDTGLCEVNDIATGFMKIRLDTVFPAMEQAFPHLEYNDKNYKGEPITSWEFFPMGVEGPRTPAARIARIKTILERYDQGELPNMQPDNMADILEAIYEACYDQQPVSTLRGEDYMFCLMARSCGFKIYADFGLPILPHVGQIGFPIAPDAVGIDTKSGELEMRKS